MADKEPHHDKTKRALVTGASGGIGLAVARRLASDGWAVTLLARRQAVLEEHVGTLAGKGHQVIAADLADAEDVSRVAAHIKENAYQLLINNAGVGLFGEFEEEDLSRQQAMLGLNCTALAVLSHAFLANAQRGDALVNVASVIGFSSMPGAAMYAGTKGFVVQFSRSLWEEQRRRGVYVMSYCPGASG